MTVVDQIDRFTRLALKAQGQCRATLETLAAIKNPPMVYARQANIAQGLQQVNNNMALPRSGNQESQQNKLLEAYDDRLDLERRARHSQAIRRWRSWERSTGPRSPEGKARSARNADRGGQWRRDRQLMQAIKTLLKSQCEELTEIGRTHQGS